MSDGMADEMRERMRKADEAARRERERRERDERGTS